ncbi:sugar isomerase domain-containing protein [Propionibacteriaceae bacterium Y1923]|uniref:sugar isomerase domain-containing protein n=1 Tax=Aestuariimicrobium sp. Y1814 TaxID=3418742 RepID=UPI003C160AA8
MPTSADLFQEQVTRRLPLLTRSAHDGPIAEAADLLADAVANGGVITAFGTGHSEAFAMEIAGRAGGLIPTSRMALRNLVLFGDRDASVLTGAGLERDPDVAADLFAEHPRDPRDAFIIISNSGVNGSIVGVAELVKQHGHPLVAVTSLEHTEAVEPKHPSGKRLKDFADVVIDNLGPFGDSTLEVTDGMTMGAISSITGAYIAQLLTLGISERLLARGITPPVYISANVPGGDVHNTALKQQYEGRLRADG